MAALSPKKKLSKLTDDIAALEKTIEENKQKLVELKEEKAAIENSEIISIIRKAGLSVEDIENLIEKSLVSDEPLSGQNMLNSFVSKTQNERKI